MKSQDLKLMVYKEVLINKEKFKEDEESFRDKIKYLFYV